FPPSEAPQPHQVRSWIHHFLVSLLKIGLTCNNPNNRGITALFRANFRETSRTFVTTFRAANNSTGGTPCGGLGKPKACNFSVKIHPARSNIGSKPRLAPASVRPSFLLSVFHGFLI